MAVAEPAIAENLAAETIDIPGITRPMSYEEYMATPEEMARYDILDGWKVYRLYGDNLMPSPTRTHQTIVLNLAEAFRSFQRRERLGEVIIAPCDVQITYQPLRSRQPDVLFMSTGRLAQNLPPDGYAPLSPAPELVVEIISPSDTPSVLARKLADYRSVNVEEVWLIDSHKGEVEIRSLADDTRRLFRAGDIALSHVFPGLAVPVDSIFQE